MTAAPFRLPGAARFAALLAALAAFPSSMCGAPAADMTIRTGEIEGARFAIARPENWSGNLLLLAHGFRPVEAPRTAEIDRDDPVHARLLADGWMIAATSYRRNGIVVRDAIADLGALRDHIERSEGPLGAVLLAGVSMGGTIVALMAENEPGRYHGAIALGAALEVCDPVYPLALTASPKIPLLFLSNEGEAAAVADYVRRAAEAPVAPALWTVAREGHVNINADERSAAIEGLIAWVTANRIERSRDVTVRLDPGPRDVVLAGGVARGSVAEVTVRHGNIFTTFRPVDFEQLGIAIGQDFELVAGARTFRVRYGTTYDDVAPGEWVAFPRAEGVILIARNHESAAETAGVKAGDRLEVRAIAAGP